MYTHKQEKLYINPHTQINIQHSVCVCVCVSDWEQRVSEVGGGGRKDV